MFFALRLQERHNCFVVLPCISFKPWVLAVLATCICRYHQLPSWSHALQSHYHFGIQSNAVFWRSLRPWGHSPVPDVPDRYIKWTAICCVAIWLLHATRLGMTLWHCGLNVLCVKTSGSEAYHKHKSDFPVLCAQSCPSSGKPSAIACQRQLSHVNSCYSYAIASLQRLISFHDLARLCAGLGFLLNLIAISNIAC